MDLAPLAGRGLYGRWLLVLAAGASRHRATLMVIVFFAWVTTAEAALSAPVDLAGKARL